jgi:mannose-6-phosphate isomerase-like protein (cupin superfamily)
MNRQTFIRTGLLASATLPLLAAEAAEDKPLKPFYIPPDPEPLVVTEGFQVRIKVRSRDTNLQMGSIELGLAPKTIGPIPHVHEKLDEVMFVHRGEVHVLVGEEVTVVKAGGYHLRPHGLVHCFWNASDQPAHFSDFFFNQNFDEFFEEWTGKILPELQAQGHGRHSEEALRRRADLNRRFGLTQYPEMAKAIVEKYGLKV